MRSLELPPSSRGPGEEMGVREETGSPGARARPPEVGASLERMFV